MKLAVSVAAIVLAGAIPAWAQTQAPATPPPASAASTAAPSASPQAPAAKAPAQLPPVIQLPVDLARIKSALREPAVVSLHEHQLRFYAEVYAREPKFSDFLGSFDLMNGPVPGAGMTHREFMDMVTPKLMNSSAGIKATEMLQFALTNAIGQALVKKAIQEIRNARTQHEVQAIRDRIDRELAALMGKSQ